jgi:hypothetical protein
MPLSIAPQCKALMHFTLNVALWIVAGLLAAVLLGTSISKMFVPREKLASVG